MLEAVITDFRAQVRAQLIESFKPRLVSGAICLLCGSRQLPVSMHLIKASLPDNLPHPQCFLAASQSRGYVSGSFPICVNCARPCKKCGIAIRSKEVVKAIESLKDAAWPNVSVTAGNGYCEHIHLLNDLLPVKKGQPLINPFANPSAGPSGRTRAKPRGTTEQAESVGQGSYRPGQRIAGKYLIHRAFEGGMGRVFLVSDGGEPFVLKTFTPGAVDPTIFAREARTWVNLGRHEHLVPAFWVDHLAGNMCVAAEFIPPDDQGRTTLRDHIRQGPVSPTRALRFAAHFAYGMQNALANGLIAHRDIKPENLLVGKNESLQITDFGIASAIPLEWPERASTAPARGISGTAPYMAPEQWRGAVQDFRTDVYAFGMVLFELCFGSHPFKAKSVGQLSRSHQSETVSVPNHPLADVIRRSIAKDPGKRFASPAEFLLTLQANAQEMGVRLPHAPLRFESSREELLARASLSATGNVEHALAAARLLTEQWPDFASGWTQLGRLLIEQNDLRGAREATKRAIDLDPTRSAPWNNLGLIYSGLGKKIEAVVAFETAIETDSLNTGAMLNMAGPLASLGRHNEAISWLERAAALAPDKSAAWFNLGSQLKARGRQIEAQTAFQRAIDCTPEHDRAGLADLIASLDEPEKGAYRTVDVASLLNAKKFDIAIPMLEHAAADTPGDPRIWHNLAMAYREQNQWAKAKAANLRLAELEPSNASVINQLIHAHMRELAWPEAISWCERLGELSGREGEAQAQHAHALHASGDTQAARKLLLSAVQAFPQDVAVRIAFGDIAMASGAPAMAAQRGYGPALKMLHGTAGDTHDYVQRCLTEALSAAERDAAT
ncbi:serine/threonine-protein kinase [uncultured Brevundimonas sp.]|uniref:serine/threonine-protein kinase n=1 Tax=uncultured Brevundimonas sp. TaxID=213418 RepID=UPI002613589F|nr:serine/threonine-protein kinase [uncultured Brevundimonas sp.]